MRCRLLVAGLALTTLAAGCGGGDDKTTATTAGASTQAPGATATTSPTPSSVQPVPAASTNPNRYQANVPVKDQKTPCFNAGAAIAKQPGEPETNFLQSVTGLLYEEVNGALISAGRTCGAAQRRVTGSPSIRLTVYDVNGQRTSTYAGLLERGLYRNETKSYAPLQPGPAIGEETKVADGFILSRVGKFGVSVEVTPPTGVSAEIHQELVRLLLKMAPA